jgi:predicted metal-dependent HD superfamily phosphohydrolase
MLFRGRRFPLDEVQTYAIWFHDAIYDPRSKTNEEDSAELARGALRSIGWDEERIERVTRIVLDTKNHAPSVPGAAEVIDLDLSSLAADWATYQRNGQHIRREYHWIPDDEFAASTSEFLASILARQRIFTTDWGAALEASARANMQRALRTMY